MKVEQPPRPGVLLYICVGSGPRPQSDLILSHVTSRATGDVGPHGQAGEAPDDVPRGAGRLSCYAGPISYLPARGAGFLPDLGFSWWPCLTGTTLPAQPWKEFTGKLNPSPRLNQF